MSIFPNSPSNPWTPILGSIALLLFSIHIVLAIQDLQERTVEPIAVTVHEIRPRCASIDAQTIIILQKRFQAFDENTTLDDLGETLIAEVEATCFSSDEQDAPFTEHEET